MKTVDISCIDEESVTRLEKAIKDAQFYHKSDLEIVSVSDVSETDFVGKHMNITVRYDEPSDLFHLGHFSCFYLMARASQCDEGCNVEKSN